MSVYVKLFKVCQDFALGKQTYNAAVQNLEYFKDSWIAEHATQEPSFPLGHGNFGDPYQAIGRHNTPPVPRAVVSVDILSAIAPSGTTAFSLGTQATVVAIQRLGTGIWAVNMNANLSTFWGIPFPVHSAAADIRFCQPRSYYPTTPGSLPTIIVNTFESSGGSAFALAEYSFSCAIYGY